MDGLKHQHDNVRPHRAAAVREFLDAEGVQQMPWPACSPDMNPIEHAWDALGRALNERDNFPQSLQELAWDLTEEWDALPIDDINKLVDSMPQRLNALIRVRAGHTQY
uniref:Tc1-like transposase DDE domain-containing protein n=1 Tax=Scophthalmus maximus TaxID=52904 RepID=A0A8D3AYH1_SCOMX